MSPADVDIVTCLFLPASPDNRGFQCVPFRGACVCVYNMCYTCRELHILLWKYLFHLIHCKPFRAKPKLGPGPGQTLGGPLTPTPEPRAGSGVASLCPLCPPTPAASLCTEQCLKWKLRHHIHQTGTHTHAHGRLLPTGAGRQLHSESTTECIRSSAWPGGQSRALPWSSRSAAPPRPLPC